MLSETQVRNAKAAEKPYKLHDSLGLFLLVSTTGARLWRFKYRFGEKEKLLALGQYPDVPLKRARQKRDEARTQVADNIDPGAARKALKRTQGNTFESVAREWHGKLSPKWDATHAQTILRRIEAGLFPWLGSRPIAEIEPPELLETLRRTEGRGAVETAHRLLQHASKIFRYAIATGRATRDPAADIRGALAPIVWKSRATILIPQKVGELLRAIHGYQGEPSTMAALKLAPLVFVRPGELRAAEWSEFELETDEPTWRIPAARMKMDTPHLVPLSHQAVTILRELRPITGHGRYTFPALTHKERPLSENTINAALRRLGYSKEEMSGHGFRAMASTLLNEQGWNADWIEVQLAHAEQNAVRAAYNYAKYLPDRRRMMQAWADYLDGLRTGSGPKVVNINRASA